MVGEYLKWRSDLIGLSTEEKPLTGEKVVDGSTFYEVDTGKFFIFYKGTWYEQGAEETSNSESEE